MHKRRARFRLLFLDYSALVEELLELGTHSQRFEGNGRRRQCRGVLNTTTTTTRIARGCDTDAIMGRRGEGLLHVASKGTILIVCVVTPLCHHSNAAC